MYEQITASEIVRGWDNFSKQWQAAQDELVDAAVLVLLPILGDLIATNPDYVDDMRGAGEPEMDQWA